MKIYVNEIPTKPNECLFSKKEKYFDNFLLNTETLRMNKVTIYKYYCNVNGKLCDLDNGCKQCDKLKVLMK